MRWADEHLDALRTHRRALVIGTAMFVAAAIAFRWARHAAGYWGIDDAGITYAASFELADHHTLAPYLEGTPVEGYSNPLVFFLVAILRYLGVFDPVTTHILLETIVFAAMVVMVWALIRSVTGEIAAVAGGVMFATIELVTPATWTWYGSGLENVWVSAGLVALLVVCARTDRGVPLTPRWGAFAFFVAITRPEAPVYVAAFYFALLVCSKPRALSIRAHVRQVAWALAITTLLYILFLCWRRIGYGDWLPNTYYAKLHDKRDLARNIRDYVVPGILPYCRAALFASTALALLLAPKLERLAPRLVIFLLASLALPITAGADWMGEHRFATPFLAMCHVTFAIFFAVCVSGLSESSLKNWRPSRVLAVVAVLLVALLLKYDRIAVRDSIDLNDVTMGRVAQLEGGQRWEQQMRIGIPYPVVQIPDAGGTLLVGSMQISDNGYLTDFQMARMARINRPTTTPIELKLVDQYQHEERRPDLMSVSTQFALDRTYLGTRYIPPGNGVMYVARDVVALDAVDPSAKLIFDDGNLQLYVSASTVALAGPSGLVRCELIAAWKDYAQEGSVKFRGAVEQGDRDEIVFDPSQRTDSGIERFGLLLGAPSYPGSFGVDVEVVHGDKSAVIRRAFTLAVTSDESALQREIGETLKLSNLERVAHRIGWLREQQVPRLGITGLHALLDALAVADNKHAPEAGSMILALRKNARLGALDGMSSTIRNAEQEVTRRLLAACPHPANSTRILCLGRVIDRLRRLGYLHALAAAPEIESELLATRDRLAAWTAGERYQALVGMTVAIPGNVRLQRQLLKARRALAKSGAYPDLR